MMRYEDDGYVNLQDRHRILSPSLFSLPSSSNICNIKFIYRASFSVGRWPTQNSLDAAEKAKRNAKPLRGIKNIFLKHRPAVTRKPSASAVSGHRRGACGSATWPNARSHRRRSAMNARNIDGAMTETACVRDSP